MNKLIEALEAAESEAASGRNGKPDFPMVHGIRALLKRARTRDKFLRKAQPEPEEKPKRIRKKVGEE